MAFVGVIDIFEKYEPTIVVLALFGNKTVSNIIIRVFSIHQRTAFFFCFVLVFNLFYDI